MTIVETINRKPHNARLLPHVMRFCFLKLVLRYQWFSVCLSWSRLRTQWSKQFHQLALELVLMLYTDLQVALTVQDV